MDEKLRAQIYNKFLLKETDELLEIWQNDDGKWDEQVFEIIKEILLDRLGYVPLESVQRQVAHILDTVRHYIQQGEVVKALAACEQAIKLNPELAYAYNYRGRIYGEMGDLDNAIISYQAAIQLNPELKEAWDAMLGVEKKLAKVFHGSAVKEHLDRALEYAYQDEKEKALEVCELAEAKMPSIAIAYNYLGMIYETIGQLELAIASYKNAIALNPRFYSARENLANARVKLEDVQYRLVEIVKDESIVELDESQATEATGCDATIPQWLYMDERSYLVDGWAGHRTRQGRSGYDPLETEFELAHMKGTIIRLLITRKFRTRQPIYLFFMIFLGLIYCLPLIMGVATFFQGALASSYMIVMYCPYWIVGILLLVNVILSLRLGKSEIDGENEFTFF